MCFINKKFIVKQNNIKDCGAACLASIVKFHGGNVPVEKVILDTNTNKIGTTGYDLVTASNKYGFEAEGFKFEAENLLKESMRLPAIFQVEENGLLHFVVLYQIDLKKAVIMDPALGIRKMKIDEFIKIITGKRIEFYPINKIIYYKHINKVNEMFKIIFLKEKKTILQMFILSFFITGLTILMSYYFKISMETLGLGFSFFKLIGLCFFVFVFLKFWFEKNKIYLENHLSKNIDAYLLKDFLKHTMYLPSKVIQTRSTGEIVSRITDLASFKNLFSEIIVAFSMDFILVLIILPVLAYINTTLFVVTILLFLAYLLVGVLFNNIIYRRIMENIQKNDQFTSVFIESISMINSIKNTSSENKALGYVEQKAAELLDHNFRFNKLNNVQINIKNFLNEIGIYSINTIGFYLIYKNKLTILDLITYNSLMIYFLNPIKNIIDSFPKYNFIKASINKLNEFMNIDLEDKSVLFNTNKFDIKFKKAVFNYNKFTPVFSDLNLEIKEGDHLLVKGKSGSGKSTICNLILNNEKLSGGELLIGGININDIKNYNVANNIVYVSQRENLYKDSIRNNIMFFRNKKEEYFHRICELCFVDEIIKSRPKRFETIVNTDQNNLSGGEKQRIILARALLGDFRVLIIDEALSEVDLETEKQIIENIKKHFKEKTIIYISHKRVENLFERKHYV